MRFASAQLKQANYLHRPEHPSFDVTSRLSCDWPTLRAQLLLQWNRLTARDLDEAGPNRMRLAQLIQRKHGIASVLVENYLRNFERTLPTIG